MWSMPELCAASTVQPPHVTGVTVLPDTVQIVGVAELNTIALPLGVPVAETLNAPFCNSLRLASAGKVTTWLSFSTFSVKFCVALPAVITIGHAPTVPLAGVPDKLPAALSVTPAGKLPVKEIVAGAPPVTTLKLDAVSTLKLAVAWLTKKVAADGVTDTAADVRPPPRLFTARTVQLYAVPLVKPVTTNGEASAVPVTLPGEQTAS